MASIEQRGQFWRAKVRIKGYPEQSASFDRKTDAKLWAQQIESEMRRGVFVSREEAERTSLSEACDRYIREILPQKKSQAPETSRINTLKAHLGEYSLAALNSSLIASFRDKRLKEVGNQSVIHEINILNRILKHADMEWGISLPSGLPTARIKKPSKPKGRDRRIVGDEIDRIVDASQSPSLKAVLTIALETAMRRSEISSLRWEYINFDKQIINLPDAKTGARSVPLSKAAVKLLKSIPRNLDGRVFHMLPDSITRAFTRACKSAGIENLHLHDFRHEATSRAFEKGLNIMEASILTGHKDLQSLKRYTHLKAEDIAKKLG